MYRENPTSNMPDSGWRFLAGNEDESFMNDSKNHHIFAINTICNYDSDIIPHLKSNVGSVFIRVEGNKFEEDDGFKEILIEKQGNSK